MLEEKSSRRDFIKKTAYTVPMIVTLKAMPAFAQVGSPAGNGGRTTGGRTGTGTNGATGTISTNGGDDRNEAGTNTRGRRNRG